MDPSPGGDPGMGTKRLAMRPYREIMRLKYEAGLGHRAIARACAVGVGTVSEYVRRAERAGLVWPLPEDLDDAALEARLFPAPAGSGWVRALPDFAKLHQELKRMGVTLQLLWQEYRQDHPDGYQYSQFCERYRRFAKKLNPSMRQVHRAGEKAFVDFSGKKPSIVDQRTGEITAVELFVGVLGASGLIYAEATLTQDPPSWIAAHVRMVEWFGGAPEIFVPDNLRSAITASCRYEPTVTRAYGDFAEHYGAVVIPARVYRPKDKPKVELSVLLAQRWILAVLRNRTFFSLAELNTAIWRRLEALNARPMQKLGVSRRQIFERLDKPALKAAAARSLRDGGVEDLSRQHRLSHRGRSQLLQRAVSAHSRARRSALHALDGRGPLQVTPHCVAPAALGPREAVDEAGTHAELAPGIRRLDAVATRQLG